MNDRYLTEDTLYNIYEKNFTKISSFVFTLVLNEQDAFDITQDAFCKALETLRRKKIENNYPLAWVYRIARNITYNQKKREINLASKMKEIIIHQKRTASFEKEALDSILLEEIFEYVNTTFTIVEKEIFGFKILHELKIDEIALITGKSVSTISRILHKLIEKITITFKLQEGE